MPRQSSAARSALTAAEPVRRLAPPPDLDPAEQKEFLDIVLSVRPDHFEPADLPLIAAYARAIVQEKLAASELRASGYVVDGKPSAWLSIWKESARSVTTLSRMLRLNPSARAPLVEEKQNVSFYERMSLEARHDEADQN